MGQIAILMLVVVSGMGLSVEAGLLGPLGEDVGHMAATLSIFLVGALLLSVALVFAPKRSLSNLMAQPRWLLTGGILGPVYVIVLTLATPVIGVGITMVGILCGQVAASLVIDHFGLFGTPRRQMDRYRLSALALILVALGILHS
ncbi:EamA-like transporter family protein [Rhizobium sp. TH135]|nr:EamA-like transporter family protein [Rhizobium sp. TH135]